MYTNRGEKTKIHPPAKKNTPTKKPKTKQNKKQKEKKKLIRSFLLTDFLGFFQPAFHISIVKTNFKKIFKMYAG